MASSTPGGERIGVALRKGAGAGRADLYDCEQAEVYVLNPVAARALVRRRGVFARLMMRSRESHKSMRMYGVVAAYVYTHTAHIHTNETCPRVFLPCS